MFPPLSLYIHIPWCIQKCPYCDFNSHQLKSQQLPEKAYIDALIEDLLQDINNVHQRPITSIFIGGGTPSLFSAEAIALLLTKITQLVEISPQAEITLEANPGTIDSHQFMEYQQIGINRISIGVQSFNNNSLSSLGRIHNAEQAQQTIQSLNTLSLNSYNIDLMHGLPNQTLENAISDLKQAIYLKPPHLSWYQLTVEPNTLFGTKPPQLPDDECLWDIFQQGQQLLCEAGYQQYETSAYSLPGHKCQHNLNYWRFGDYLGIGCGAHGKITTDDKRIFRTEKTRHPKGYLQGNYHYKHHYVSFDERPFEFFMNRFRLYEAVERNDFEKLTFLSEKRIRHPLNKAIKKELIIETNNSWQTTDKGKLFLNDLLTLFL